MTRGVITVRPETLVIEAANIMAKSKVSGLCVVDEIGKGIGTITETDLVNALSHKKSVKHLKVVNIMTETVLTVNPEMTLREVVKIMEKKEVGRLFVLSPHGLAVPTLKRPIGVVSASDIIRVIAEEKV